MSPHARTHTQTHTHTHHTHAHHTHANHTHAHTHTHTHTHTQVASLFHRHTDLLHKFSIFLPEQESMGGEGAGDDADGGGGTKRYALNASHMH